MEILKVPRRLHLKTLGAVVLTDYQGGGLISFAAQKMESTHKPYSTEFILRSWYSTTRQDIPRLCATRGFTATLTKAHYWSIPFNISALLFLNILNTILPSSGLRGSNRRLRRKCKTKTLMICTLAKHCSGYDTEYCVADLADGACGTHGGGECVQDFDRKT